MNRSFLHWPGGKRKLLPLILPELKGFRDFVEPFCGSGVVFLNAPNKNKMVGDLNPDLINLFTVLRDDPKGFVKQCKPLFGDGRDATVFYANRKRFNEATNIKERAALFVYLNRHGYNGLCRYNSKGEFNVPLGTCKSANCPEEEMLNFADATKDVQFFCCDFMEMFKKATDDCVFYVDPPYVAPDAAPGNFAEYTKGGFAVADLAKLSTAVSASPSKVVVSLFDTPVVREMFKGMRFQSFNVQRSISCKERKKVAEVLIVKEKR